jgi:putative FmdB family regulatory protein
MPLYDYKCSRCGFFEAWRGLDDSEILCPQCGDPAKREPCSGSPIIFGETVGKASPGKLMREEP